MMRKQVCHCAAVLLLAIGSLFFNPAAAQRPQVSAELDSVSIWVGNQVGLRVDISVARGEAVTLLPLRDSLGSSVEVVEALRQDTLTEGDVIHYVRRYLLTSFDTGLHYVAPVPVLRCDDGTEVGTPEFALNVLNPFQDIKMDDQSGVALIYDIHEAETAPFLWRELLEYWPWLVFGLVAIGVVFLGVWLYRKYGRKTRGVVEKKEPDEPCEVTAIRSLERIREEKLWQHNRVKDYYSDLTDTLRRYISARYGINALESTTAEIVDDLSSLKRTNKQELSDLEEILSQADFVKFAKHDPLPDENDKAMKQAFNFVTETTEVVKRQQEERELADAKAVPSAEDEVGKQNEQGNRK